IIRHMRRAIWPSLFEDSVIVCRRGAGFLGLSSPSIRIQGRRASNDFADPKRKFLERPQTRESHLAPCDGAEDQDRGKTGQTQPIERIANRAVYQESQGWNEKRTQTGDRKGGRQEGLGPSKDDQPNYDGRRDQVHGGEEGCCAIGQGPAPPDEMISKTRVAPPCTSVTEY